MILVDTSVWVDHLRRGVGPLAALLESAGVLVHPFVIGEIACGNLSDRQTVLGLLAALRLQRGRRVLGVQHPIELRAGRSHPAAVTPRWTRCAR